MAEGMVGYRDPESDYTAKSERVPSVQNQIIDLIAVIAAANETLSKVLDGNPVHLVGESSKPQPDVPGIEFALSDLTERAYTVRKNCDRVLERIGRL